MAEIFPFCAYRYNAARVRHEDVLTQPYDKITPQMQEQYYARSPYNLIAVEKGKTLPGDGAADNVYVRARDALDKWIAGQILVREPAPAIYAYFQQFTVPGTAEQHMRRGFIALGRVHDYSDRVVHRHEQTLSGPRADRLELLRHTRAHTGQLFMLYSDPQQRIDMLLEEVAAASPPATDVRDEYGVTHRLWPITSAALVRQVVATMAEKKLVIADGHHRYETAVAYRDECRATAGPLALDAPHERVMMTFVNCDAPGLTILPTHRVLAGVPGFAPGALLAALAQWFDARTFAADAQESTIQQALLAARAQRGVGLYTAGRFHLLTLKPAVNLSALLPGVSQAQWELDVVLLHRLILQQGLGITAEAVRKESYLRYERQMQNAIAAVQRGEAQACFLLNAVEVRQVMQMALAGEVLPQKSTDFFPKMLSGITIYRLDG